MLKVSILVPVYGVGPYIEQCAESLFSQTYPAVEFIFVDDCTPDDSIEKLKACMARYPQQAAKAKIIHHHENHGLGASRQTGLEAATGDAVTIVDSDDFLAPNAVALLVEKMNASGADIVEGAYYRLGCKHEKIVLPAHTSKRRRIKTLLWHKGNGFIWGKLYRRDLFTQHDIKFTEGVDYGEDYSVLPRLLLVGSRVWIDNVVYTYRCNRLNSYTTAQSLKSMISLAKAIKIVEAFFLRKDSQGTYRQALHLGMLSMYAHAIKFNIERKDLPQIDRIMNYQPNGILSGFLYWLLHVTYPSKVTRKVFCAVRRYHLYVHCW